MKSLLNKTLMQFIICAVILLLIATPLFYFLVEHYYAEDLIEIMNAAEQGNPYAGYQLGRLYLYGIEVDRNAEKAIALLTASAAQGNPYATQLLKHYRQNKNWAAVMGSFRLLQHMAGVISGQLYSDEDGGRSQTDRKLRRRIDEKKMLHGIRG